MPEIVPDLSGDTSLQKYFGDYIGIYHKSSARMNGWRSGQRKTVKMKNVGSAFSPVPAFTDLVDRMESMTHLTNNRTLHRGTTPGMPLFITHPVSRQKCTGGSATPSLESYFNADTKSMDW